MSFTKEQQLAWQEFRLICYQNGLDSPQTIFPPERKTELDHKLFETMHGVRGAVGAVASASHNHDLYRLPEVLSPSEAISFAINGIYDDGVVNPYLFQAGKLLLVQPEVVAAIKNRPAILKLLQEKVLPDLDQQAKDSNAGIKKFPGLGNVNFGDGNNRRAEEVAKIIRELILEAGSAEAA